MAWRYRQNYPQNGEVLNPQDWNLENKEFAEEFNGYLDRDNLPEEVFTSAHVADDTFTAVTSDPYTGTEPFGPRENTIEWQSNDGTRNLGKIEIEAPVDELLICEFSATWASNNSPKQGDVRFRVLVDGSEVAMTGFIGQQWEEWSDYCCGAIPVSAGKHTIEAQVQIANANWRGQGYRANENPVADIQERELIVIERRR